MRSLMLAFLIALATVPATAQDSNVPAREYKPPPGYKTRHRGDKTIYCRKATELGSRFLVEKCFTKEELKIELARIEAAKEEFERGRRVCSTATQCANN